MWSFHQIWKNTKHAGFGGDTIPDQFTSISIKAIIPDGVNFIEDLLEPKLISLQLVKKEFGRIIFHSIEIYPPDASQWKGARHEPPSLVKWWKIWRQKYEKNKNPFTICFSPLCSRDCGSWASKILSSWGNVSVSLSFSFWENVSFFYCHFHFEKMCFF